MEKRLHGNAMVGQSGGPTAAINATLGGVIRGAIRHGGADGCIERLYGVRNGIEGLLEERWIDLTDLFGGENRDETFRLLEQTPAAVLGSCRKKLPDPLSRDEQDLAIYEKIFEIFRKNRIRYFFYIGGNDSMDTVLKLSTYAEKHNCEMRIIGVPKTIDNDLPLTDHAPGYGSAAKFIATVTQEIIRDCSVYTVPAVTIVECMGRDAGWLTAASALGRVTGGSAPDLVYLSERAFDLEAFFQSVAEKLAEHPNVVVAVSEGLRFADGRYVGEGHQNGVFDIFGHKYLSGTGKTLEIAVKERFGCKVRSVELNLPQRCAGHLLSLTDITESAEIGEAAVTAAVEGISGEVMIFRRLEGDSYSCRTDHVNVSKIANQTQPVPDAFITENGDNITDSCCKYLLPLIQGECDILYNQGLPRHLVL